MIKTSEDLCDCRIIHQSRVERAKKNVIDAEKIDKLTQLFKAIAEPGRVKIIQALKHDEMCVCDLAAFLEVSESAVSHQLRMLRQLQLVTNRREGAVLYYRVNKTIANQLLDFGLKYLEGESL